MLAANAERAIPKAAHAAVPLAQYVVEVTNTGSIDADDVVLGLLKPPGAGVGGTPLQTLFGFERVHLAPGASTTLSFTVNATQLALADAEGHASLHAGRYELIFSRGCKGCDELRAPLAVDVARPVRLKTFRKWW